MPLEFVVAVVTPPANVPLAPDAGAAKVTVAPLMGVEPFITVTTNGLVNAAPTCALCPEPLVAAITSAGCEEELQPTRKEAKMIRKTAPTRRTGEFISITSSIFRTIVGVLQGGKALHFGKHLSGLRMSLM
jgi:hypothetical protein